jgi:hypothetical protein
VISDHRVCDVAAAIERVPAIGAAAREAESIGSKNAVKDILSRTISVCRSAQNPRREVYISGQGSNQPSIEKPDLCRIVDMRAENAPLMLWSVLAQTIWSSDQRRTSRVQDAFQRGTKFGAPKLLGRRTSNPCKTWPIGHGTINKC